MQKDTEVQFLFLINRKKAGGNVKKIANKSFTKHLTTISILSEQIKKRKIEN